MATVDGYNIAQSLQGLGCRLPETLTKIAPGPKPSLYAERFSQHPSLSALPTPPLALLLADDRRPLSLQLFRRQVSNVRGNVPMITERILHTCLPVAVELVRGLHQ